MTTLIEVETDKGMVMIQATSLEAICPHAEKLSEKDDLPCAVIFVGGDEMILKQSYRGLRRELSGNGIKIIRG